MSRRSKAFAILLIYALALPILFSATFGWLETAAAQQQATPAGVWGDPHVGVVADTTATMGPALDALAEAWQAQNLVRPLTATLHLVTFKDDVNYVDNTTAPGEFGTWLAGLEASGGGECPDNALAGLLEMGRRTPAGNTPTTEVLLATDAAPRGGRTAYAYVANRLLKRGVRVHALINGWCPNPPISPVAVGFLAMATGGKYIPSDAANYVTDTLIALNRIAAADRIVDFQGTVTSGDPQIFMVDVDSTLSALGVADDDYYDCLTCIRRLPTMTTAVMRSPDTVTVEISDPNGNPVGPATPGYELLVNDYRRFQGIYPPGAPLVTGTWTIRVSGEGDFALQVMGDAGLHLVYPGEHTYPVGATVPFRAALVNEFGAPGIVNSATFALMSMDGQQTQPLELFDDGQHGDGAAGDGLYGGPVMRDQQGCWILVAQGTLSDGTKFRRLYPAPIRFRGFRMPNPPATSAVPGTMRVVEFAITNNESARGGTATTFDLGVYSEQGWAITDTVPVSITLQPGEVVNLQVPVQIPTDALPGAADDIVLVAAPVTDIGLSTSATAVVDVVENFSLYLPISAVKTPD